MRAVMGVPRPEELGALRALYRDHHINRETGVNKLHLFVSFRLPWRVMETTESS
jgi:hypothetical protein